MVGTSPPRQDDLQTRRITMSKLFRSGAIHFVAALFVSILSASSARSQGPDAGALASDYAANAKQNATLMRSYMWKMRVELTLKGETKPASVYQLRYDLDGKLQKTLLTAPPAAPKGLGHRIKEEKIAEFKDWAGDLAELVKQYMAPTPGNMMDFYSKARVTSAPDGTAQATAGSFLKPGDTATFWIDKATKIPVRYAFTTALDADPVSGQVEYGKVDGGPQYAARITLSVPTKELTAKVETFEYVKQ
jgi:hypothetical protein